MFRVVATTRLHGHRPGSRLSKTIRHYSKTKHDICPPPESKLPRQGTGTIYTVGIVALLGGGTIAFAKYDPEFRKWLTGVAPATNGLLKFLFQEEMSYYASMTSLFHAIAKKFETQQKVAKKKLTELVDDGIKSYKAPPPVITKLAEKEEVPEECYTEVRMESVTKGKESNPSVEIEGETRESVNASVPAKTPLMILGDLEAKASASVTAAIEGYNAATSALMNYNHDVQYVIDNSIESIDQRVWGSMKAKAIKKDESLINATKSATVAVKDISEMKTALDTTSGNVPDVVKEQARRNLRKVQEDLMDAKKELDEQMKKTHVTEQYWEKVSEARKHFGEELTSLFPRIDLNEKELNISDGDLDLFVLHAMSKVLYYQKELFKLETIQNDKLNAAVEEAKRGGGEILSAEQVYQELEKERIKLEENFQKKCLKMRNESEHHLRQRLKTQSEVFNDHLNDALKLREMEVEQIFNRNFDEKITEERCKYKMEVAAMVGRLRGMDQAFKAKAESDRIAHQSQVLWSACQALFKAVKAGCPGVPWKDQLRPLEPEISAVVKASASGDDLVKAVINGIPEEAKIRGVFPEDALRERFLKVEKVARSMALVPASGARLHMYLLSYLQSFFLLRAASPIPQAELNDEIIDFSKLDTNEILQRARYWIDRGDFAQALRYMNLLKGGSRSVSRQWMEETRILLETQQAANTLMAHAAASGLQYL